MSEFLKPHAAVAIYYDKAGKVLWVERYIMSGIHRPDETFIENHKEYLILESAFTYGRRTGLVEYVVELIADRAPRANDDF